MTESATSRQRHDGGSAPTALYRQHHDVEAPRVDDRHFRPAWRVLTRLDGLLADRAITSAEWHAAADFRAVLSAWACTLLEAALVRDLSWAALGRHYRCDPKTARAWVIAAIKALRTV